MGKSERDGGITEQSKVSLKLSKGVVCARKGKDQKAGNDNTTEWSERCGKSWRGSACGEGRAKEQNVTRLQCWVRIKLFTALHATAGMKWPFKGQRHKVKFTHLCHFLFCFLMGAAVLSQRHMCLAIICPAKSTWGEISLASFNLGTILYRAGIRADVSPHPSGRLHPWLVIGAKGISASYALGDQICTIAACKPACRALHYAMAAAFSKSASVEYR